MKVKANTMVCPGELLNLLSFHLSKHVSGLRWRENIERYNKPSSIARSSYTVRLMGWRNGQYEKRFSSFFPRHPKNYAMTCRLNRWWYWKGSPTSSTEQVIIMLLAPIRKRQSSLTELAKVNSKETGTRFIEHLAKRNSNKSITCQANSKNPNY